MFLVIYTKRNGRIKQKRRRVVTPGVGGKRVKGTLEGAQDGRELGRRDEEGVSCL